MNAHVNLFFYVFCINMTGAIDAYYNEMTLSDREEFGDWLDDNCELFDEDCGIFNIAYKTSPSSIYQKNDGKLSLTDDGEEFLKYYVVSMQEFLHDSSSNATILHSHYEDYKDYVQEQEEEEEDTESEVELPSEDYESDESENDESYH